MSSHAVAPGATRELEDDAILRVCSYHRRDFDLVVVRSHPHDTEKVQTSLQTPFDTPPVTQLGLLDTLPPELMSMTLRLLDVRSFFRFRQVSRQARNLATKLWEYKLVARHGLEGLRGLLRAGLADGFTIDDLYHPLLTDECSACGGFGSHLFLFAAERCCFKCLQSSTRYRVSSVSAFAKASHVSPARIIRLPGQRLRTVPGIYNMMEKPPRRPAYLVSEEKLAQTLRASGVIEDDVIRNLASRAEQSDQRFMAVTAYPCYDRESTTLETGVSCKGCQVRLEARRRGFGDRDRVFSRRGFLLHFAECEESRQLWEQSDGGTRPVDEPELSRRCGYFNQLGADGRPN